jgi:hypothetical protein
MGRKTGVYDGHCGSRWNRNPEPMEDSLVFRIFDIVRVLSGFYTTNHPECERDSKGRKRFW